MCPPTILAARSVLPTLSLTTVRGRALLVALAMLGALGGVPALIPSAQGAGEGDLGHILTQPTTWVLDQSTGTGYRVDDVIERAEYGDYHGQLATSGPTGYRPAQVREAYGFDELSKSNTGAGQIIGIVDAFDYPTAGADLKKFIKTFNLKQMYGPGGKGPCAVAAGPHPCFQVLYAQGTQPAFDAGSTLESALDIQWAHAIAPGADILLVESATNSLFDLIAGVDATVSAGASIVSMSWGSAEFAIEGILDHHFNYAGLTFIAASGDSGHGGFYPAASPFVVGVGGTRLPLGKSGDRKGDETAWTGSGGGISPVEPEPGYQASYPIPSTAGFRGTPDVAYNADPATGVSVYTSVTIAAQTGWFTLGGTSAAAPQWAGLIALANELRTTGNLSTSDLLHAPLYDAAAGSRYKKNYRDITAGSNGACGSVCTAGTGYDFVTGLGSPRANKLVKFLGTL